MRFTEVHGQYGDILDPTTRSGGLVDADGNARSGYDIVDEGGFSKDVHQIFYGSDVVDSRWVPMSWDEESMAGTVAQNQPIIRRLLQLQGKGIRSGREAMITASADTDVYIERLKAQIEMITARPDSHRYRTLREILLRLHSRIDHWEAASDDDKDKALERVVTSATSLARPGNWPLLHSDQADKSYRDLLELAANVQHIGTDSSNGTRNIYGLHAYTVTGVTFRNAKREVLDLDPAKLADALPGIDPEQSTVELLNPHRTNEPDMQGDGPADGVDDGRFDLTLDQFFRNFAELDVAVVDVAAGS